LFVFIAGGSWLRFVLTGHVTGGKLKAPADADAESLQAKWIADLGELSLRASDLVSLVDRGRQYAMRAPQESWHPEQVSY
jgi:8-oxo-dGDP phosphatase